MLRSDLTQVALALAAAGDPTGASLSWVDAPPWPSLQRDLGLLASLGAVELQRHSAAATSASEGSEAVASDITGVRVTWVGRGMQGVGLHPRHARMLLDGLLVGMAMEEQVSRIDGGEKGQQGGGGGSELERGRGTRAVDAALHPARVACALVAALSDRDVVIGTGRGPTSLRPGAAGGGAAGEARGGVERSGKVAGRGGGCGEGEAGMEGRRGCVATAGGGSGGGIWWAWVGGGRGSGCGCWWRGREWRCRRA